MTNHLMPETIRIADSDRYGETTAFAAPETMEAAFMDMWQMTAADAHELAELPETQSNIYHATLVQEAPYELAGIYAANGRYYYVSEFEDGIGFAELTNRPAHISIDNGNTWQTADELFEDERFLANKDAYWAQIVDRMDDELRENLSFVFEGSSDLIFLRAYCERAEEDICIG